MQIAIVLGTVYNYFAKLKVKQGDTTQTFNSIDQEDILRKKGETLAERLNDAPQHPLKLVSLV